MSSDGADTCKRKYFAALEDLDAKKRAIAKAGLVADSGRQAQQKRAEPEVLLRQLTERLGKLYRHLPSAQAAIAAPAATRTRRGS